MCYTYWVTLAQSFSCPPDAMSSRRAVHLRLGAPNLPRHQNRSNSFRLIFLATSHGLTPIESHSYEPPRGAPYFWAHFCRPVRFFSPLVTRHLSPAFATLTKKRGVYLVSSHFGTRANVCGDSSLFPPRIAGQSNVGCFYGFLALRGSSEGSTYVVEEGPKPVTCTTTGSSPVSAK